MQQAAILDIGSNSIRYAKGWVEGERVHMAPKQVQTTRLAEGLSKSGRLGEMPMLRSLWAIEAFAAAAKEEGLPLYAYATNAVRDSQNREEFCRRVEALGVPLEVLSGEEEARLAILGATGGQGGLIDIGGGSTEIVAPGCMRSAPIGCVRAWELTGGAKDLDAMKQLVFARCKELFESLEAQDTPFTGAGGTITTIAALMLGLPAYDGQKVAAMPICHTALDELVEWLYDLGNAGRNAQPLLKGRENTILPGALILVFLMARLGIGELRVSDRDGMEGYLMKKLGAGAPAAHC